MATVEMFTGPGCTHCAAARRLLVEGGIDYEERSIDDDAELEEFRRRLPR